ncbi:hypothetical protein PIIN_06431 [Serendipita indica DSM 11827]|uniref:Uncharacterized protein n=1 Tax=Serendipita indica (strain DSM 11827) TaxID=1109443 RepID=G4TME9_SERID|nr:hypothetical protein PIIN_06431 [Serendipita indica DSM 11827]
MLAAARILRVPVGFQNDLNILKPILYDQRRQFVKPRTKIKDPLADAPSTTLSYPSVTETKDIPEDGASADKLTFIHRPPPTSPSPYSMINAPSSPLLRTPKQHQGPYKGFVKLLPGKAPIISLDGEIGEAQRFTPLTSSQLQQRHASEPPLLRPYPHEKTRHLTAEELSRMRTLRETNPKLYTRSKLAKMFNCAPVFVSMAAPLPRDKLKEVWKAQEDEKKGWTWRKQALREMRRKRRNLW